ncbi:MAG: hypothetical protein ACKV22_06730 [Bryobacteraceae bacterium]
MFSRLLRRVHMYLGLFLTPWILMYALSTVAMNHRHLFGEKPPPFERERELVYDGPSLEGLQPRDAAVQLLIHLRMDGPHNARRREDRLAIDRFDPVNPRRITYHPQDKKVVIDRQVFHMPAFLERLHRRRGYEQPYAGARVWGVSVDFAIAAMIFWVASGLWMWWELKVTRALGALFAGLGLALFVLFLVRI